LSILSISSKASVSASLASISAILPAAIAFSSAAIAFSSAGVEPDTHGHHREDIKQMQIRGKEDGGKPPISASFIPSVAISTAIVTFSSARNRNGWNDPH
jgi:hypothetical protein